MTDLELVPGTLLGHRSWHFRPAKNDLAGIFVRYSWKDGWNESKCAKPMCNCLLCRLCDTDDFDDLKPTHQPPDKTCDCGFYAFWEKNQNLNLTTARIYGDIILSGIVEASGRILIGTHGFRAERARIHTLLVPDICWSNILVREIAERYPSVVIVRHPDDLPEVKRPDFVLEPQHLIPRREKFGNQELKGELR